VKEEWSSLLRVSKIFGVVWEAKWECSNGNKIRVIVKITAILIRNKCKIIKKKGI
jgi:hypothetical protein